MALAYALVLLVGLPLLALRTGLKDEHAREVAKARTAVYLSAAVSTAILLAVTFGVAAWQDLAPSALGWKVDAAIPAFTWAAAVSLTGLAVVWLVVRLGRALRLPESRISFHLMPRSGRERRAFLVVAVVAAVGEEYLYRGFMYRVFADALGSDWVAVALTSVSFGIAHGYQRAVGMLRAGILGALLAIPVVWTGSLFPA
ncbi:MAG TPA: CPBP family intramembrane glutamic endopeptidase, partial [Longimicrobiales bacterium]|nr:CPBP family intramembrane glutamic endopeptidase [Longimicrobiales bacterium]